MADAQQELQTKITESLYGLFEDAIATRAAEYTRDPSKRPTRREVDGIISKAANTNAAVAAAANLIPGPLGMLAAVPEIALVLRNQTKMIYDLGVAHGQERYMRSELVVGIVASGAGGSTTALIVVQGGRLLVKRASLRVMQQILKMLGAQITQRVLKSMIGKWLPVVGAAAMAAWARYTTKQLGERAVAMLSLPIVEAGDLDETALLPAPEHSGGRRSLPPPSPAEASEDQVERAKVQVLTNLMLADGEAHPEEVAMIAGVVNGARIPEVERQRLLGDLSAGRRGTVDFSVFAGSPDDRMGLLFAMAGLAMRDGRLHIAERLYIKQTGQQLGFSESDVDAALGATALQGPMAPDARRKRAMTVIAATLAFVAAAVAVWVLSSRMA